MRTLVAVALVASACSSASSTTPPGGGEPPTLEIDTPTRGTTVDGSTVNVTGKVTGGAGAVNVTVDGAAVQLGSDGSFSAQVPVADGIDIIETHAIDSAGNDVRDVRAVLAGALEASDGTHTAPLATHASKAALGKIASAVATDAAALDYTSIAQGLNPIYDNGGCLGATVNITSVSLSGVDVGLDPQAGALATSVTIHDVNVQLHASFKVACIGGSGTITVTASAAHVNGNLGVSVSGGKLTTSLPNASVTLDGFNLSVSGIPSEVTGLFDGIVQGKVQSALQSAIQSKVPGIANDKLNGLLAKPFDEMLLGQEVTLGVTPTEATVDTDGVFLAVDTTVAVANGQGGMYLSEPATSAAPLMTSTSGLGVAIANDAVNQLLAGLWAAGAFDQKIAASSIPGIGVFLDPNATQLVLSTSLPPTAATDAGGNLSLALGDAVISVQDDSGTELQKIALSVKTDMSMTASSSGQIALTLGTPTVYAQVLVQATDGSQQLADSQVEGIVTGAWGIVSGQASDALAKLPMPAIAGVQLGAPTVTSSGNYVIADIPLD